MNIDKLTFDKAS